SGTPCDGWFAFDAILVLSSYLERIIELISGESAEQLMLLRLLRLFRLVRTFRMVKQVRPLWRLVHGLMTSLDTVLSTFLLLGLVLYVFGVLGVELIATSDSFKSDPVTNAILESNFSSLGFTMITLAQFVTLDSIAALYFPLVRVQPWLMLYFASLIAIVSISVMNLVPGGFGVWLKRLGQFGFNFQERMRSANTQQMLPEILELFDRADEDGSGELAIDEMRRFEEAGHVPEQILDRASVSSMTELFNVLDVDKSGVVTREEFAEGLLDILLRDVSVSSLQQMKILGQDSSRNTC
ncbi:CACNA1I, partial [Symbiodinium necroappetens]